MHADVPKIVHRHNGARLQLVLNTYIHLIGTWRLVVGRIERHAGHIRSRRQSITDKATVCLCPSLSRRLLELLLKSDHLRYDIANGLTAESGSIHNTSIRQVQLTTGANVLSQVEEAARQSPRAIEQHVVEHRIFVVDARPRADRGFSMIPRVPGEPYSPAHVSVWLVNRSSKSWAHLIEQVSAASESWSSAAGHGSQVGIGTTRVAIVANAIQQGKVRLHFPVIASIDLEARIELASAVLSKLLDFRKAPLSIAQSNACHRIIQWIRGTARKGPPGGSGFGTGSECAANCRIDSIEAGEASSQDSIEANTIAKNVRAIGLAAVVFDLFVGLVGLLRSENICAGADQCGAIGATRTAIADVDHCSGRDISDTGSGHRIADAIAEFHIADTEAVRERSR